jgi:hypothetical protein
VFTFEVDTSELDRAVEENVPKLEEDLHAGALEAAKQGVKAEQTTHPYTDRTWNLTNTAHAEADPEGAVMMWPADYAGILNRRSKYKFTPIARRTAKEFDKKNADEAVAAFKAKMER